MPLTLKPSEIFFSQRGISGKFGKSTCHKNRHIGKTLDGLKSGMIKTSDIPTIKVVKKDGKWFTLDNRRLWLFRSLHEVGKCDTIEVQEDVYDKNRHGEKFSTNNGGVSVRINGRYRGEDSDSSGCEDGAFGFDDYDCFDEDNEYDNNDDFW